MSNPTKVTDPCAVRDEAPGRDYPRFLFYSHDGLGLGHTRRNIAIAAALVAAAAATRVRHGVPRATRVWV